MRAFAPRYLWLIAAALILGALYWNNAPRGSSDPRGQAQNPVADVSAPRAARPAQAATDYPAFLPGEAHDVLRRIADGGPFEHRQDGSTFQNRERRLPPQPRGYYREYTVETPGSDDRGARRIVTGGDPPSEYYYSDDHYRSFRRFDPPSQGAAR